MISKGYNILGFGTKVIKNYKTYRKFEDKLISKDKVDLRDNFFIVEEMYKEAVELGAFPVKNPLEDIEDDIKLAKILNSVSEINSKDSK